MKSSVKRRIIAAWCAGRGHYCFWCGRPFGQDAMAATVDHFIPRSRGGLNAPHNTVVAHQICNGYRGNRIPTEDEMRRFVGLTGVAGKQVLAHYASLLVREIRRAPVSNAFSLVSA